MSKAPFKLYLAIAHLLTPTKNLSTPFNKNTPKPQMISSHPQMLIPHQFATVQLKYVLQSLPSLMVQGQAQTAYGHNI